MCFAFLKKFFPSKNRMFSDNQVDGDLIIDGEKMPKNYKGKKGPIRIGSGNRVKGDMVIKNVTINGRNV